MRTNTAEVPVPRLTHEGAKAVKTSAVQQLRRSVMSCMLWEDSFYESGVEIATRIQQEVAEVLKLANGADLVGNIAYEARTKFKLRHAPLWLALALVKANTPESRKVVSGVLAAVIQRPDELGEFLSMYWKDGKKPIPNQVKKGLAAAFQKFNAYSLAKYNRDAKIKLRDVMFLVHPKPLDQEQTVAWKKLAENTLESPDTWEVALSVGGDKKEEFTRLLSENKLGALALLRNLRNMQQAGVDENLIREGLKTMNTERVLPFRFITAARYAPTLEPELEQAMFKCLEGAEKLSGRTVLLVDVSGSMTSGISGKTEISRIDAACGLAMLLRDICEDGQIVTFDSDARLLPARRGFALRDAINSQVGGSTNTQNGIFKAAELNYDRLIIITDEQSHQSIDNPLVGTKGYVINVASYQNGVGYGPWVHVDGWSEAVVDYILQYEQN